MALLKISVERLNAPLDGSYREVYCNSLEFDDSVSIPFNQLYESLRILYPYENVVINFKLA